MCRNTLLDNAIDGIVRGIRVTHNVFERLALKVARSVLRRGGCSNVGSLSDKKSKSETFG
jgi:hypothetical protein